MVCPNCNYEIKDGNVYCENCGFEIQFVPEFEPVIDHAIEDSISNLVESTFKEQGEDKETGDGMGDTIDLSKRWKLLQTKDISQIVKEEQKDKDLLEEEKKRKNKLRWLILIPIVIGVVVLCVAGFYANLLFRQYKSTTPEVLLSNADEAYHDGRFSEAEDYYRLILDKDPIFFEARLGLARCLRKENKLEESATAYEELIADQPDEILYEELIEIYEKQKDYESIHDLIFNCPDELIYQKFSKYISDAPVFSEEEGTFENSLELKILSQKAGDIYYTLDGSEPTTSGIHYDGPIFLENGKYVVRAVFVNEMGILSDSIAGVYEIHSVLPQLPTIKPAAGNFTHSEYIVASSDQGLDIFYTDDGTMPDETSSKYEEPLLMNLGISEYKFVCIDKQGKRSDIVSVTYELQPETMCTESDAINCVLASVALIGQTSDLLGTAFDGSGKYEYKPIGVIPFQGNDYYLLKETLLKTNSEEAVPTGKYYAIDTKLGLLFTATKTDSGEFGLLPFS